MVEIRRYRDAGLRQTGFTLLELLIAMTLMGLVLAMLTREKH